jgi:alpha-L-rhamnosidase
VWVWEYYLYSGDIHFLNENYLKLKSIADYVHRHWDSATGLIHRLRGGSGAYQYGIVDWPPSMRYGYDMATVARTVINAYAYAGYDIMAKIAAEVGNAADEDKYHILAETLKSAINQQLIHGQGVYVDGLDAGGEQSAHISQHANMLPLALGIVPADKQVGVLQKVKELKMSAGMVTVWWLLQALGKMGEGEHLVDLYTQTAWDGWARNLAQGATCTWESWDADAVEGLSLSHPWGAVGLCGLQRYVLGVKPLAPQYEKVQIKPLPFGLKVISASGRLPTDRGDIFVSWKRHNGRFAMTISLPANVQARVCLLWGDASGTAVLMDGVEACGIVEGDYLVVENVSSGTHTFEPMVAL